MKVLATKALKIILNVGKSNDASRNRQRVEDQQVSLGPAPNEESDSTVISLQVVIADEVMSKVENALEAVQHMWAAAAEQFICEATLSTEGGVCSVVYDAMEHVILDQMRTAVFGKRINNHVDKHFQAGNSIEAYCRKWLPNYKLLAPITSLVQTEIMDAITNRGRVYVFRYTSIANGGKKDAAGVAEPILGHGEPARGVPEALVRRAVKVISLAEPETVF